MRKPKWVHALSILAAALIMALPVTGAAQTVRSFLEDFITTDHMDGLNTTAYWDSTDGRLKLFPFQPTRVGQVMTPGAASDVAISGNYAYAVVLFGLQVIDISHPTAPVPLGVAFMPDARAVAISGDYAYVAYGPELFAVDISDPNMPVPQGSWPMPGDGYDVAISGDYAYVACAAGLVVMDISDPALPVAAGICYTGDARAVAISGDYAFVAHQGGDLWVIDITIPTTPVPLMPLPLPVPGLELDLAISGDYAYVTDDIIGLTPIDISDPMAPVPFGTYFVPGAQAVVISGDYAYVASATVGLGLQVLDISDPSAPSFVGSCDTPGGAMSVAVSGDYAYVGDPTSGLEVIEIAEPVLPPRLAGGYDTPGGAYGVAVAGDYAYVADYGRGLQVIDISNPTSPTAAGDLDTPDYAWGVAVAGDYAYVADHGSGLQVMDISNPTAPTLAGSCPTLNDATDVVIEGDYAYVADGANGLRVVDITIPILPTLVGSYNTSGAIFFRLTVAGDYAYVADRANGLQVIDISNPTQPAHEATYATPGSASWVAISGDYAYVADWESGLLVLDISDPTAPAFAGSYDTGYDPFVPARFVTIAGDYAYVGKGNAELQVFDITDPTTPTLIGKYDTPGGYYGAVIAGDYLYVADSGGGLQVIQVFQRDVDTANNVGQSNTINSAAGEVVSVKLTTVQADSVGWSVSADGGLNWEAVAPGAGWHDLVYTGSDLRWRSNHVQVAPHVNPWCDSLFVEWMEILPDDDGDGVPNAADLCPDVNASYFDRDGDGCIDAWIGARQTSYWTPDDMPFEYWINEDGAFGITDGSDFTAVQDGMNAWAAVPGVDFSVSYMGPTAQKDARFLDGINLVTFEDPDLQFLSGVIAVGFTTTFTEPTIFNGRMIRPGQIVDADMIFSKQRTFSTTSMGSGPDIESVAVHEAGHLFGIFHSAIQTSTMFYILPPGREAASLSLEDSAIFFRGYHDPAEAAGANILTGTVRDSLTGEPVPGAIVFAINASTTDTLGCEFTLPPEILPTPGMAQEGSFCFSGLPDGDYYVAIYPLNGTSPIKFLEAYNVSALLDTTAVINFVPEYWDSDESASDDPTAMTPIPVAGGDSVHVELVLNVDTTAPTVLSVTPQDGEGNVRNDAAVIITFSEPIDVSTLSISTFSLTPSLGGASVGGLASFPRVKDDSLLAFTPFVGLDYATSYRLTLETGLTDKFGNGLANPFVSEFTVENEPPVSIASLSPSKGIIGSKVAISGLGFSSIAEEDTVLFSGVQAAVDDAQPNQLVVTVPGGIPVGALVSVRVGPYASAPLTFTVLPATEVARGIETGVVNLGASPKSLAVKPDGNDVYVATESGVTRIDVAPGATFLDDETVAILGGVDDLDINPQGNRIYAVGRSEEALHVIDVSNPLSTVVLQTLPVGAEPIGIVVDPRGDRAYVATDASEIQIWDISRRRLPTQAHAEQIGTIPSFDPNLRKKMAIDPVRNYLLALSGLGKVLVFDLSGDSLLTDVSVGTDPRDVVVDPFAKRAYVSDATGAVTAVRLDLDPPSYDGDIYTGGSPMGMAITPAGRFIYATNRDLDLLQAIDLLPGSTAYRSVAATIPHRSRPVDIDISPDGSYAYSIADGQNQFVVTTIGLGPTLKSLSRSAGPVGTKLVLSGDGFGEDATQTTVSFNGVTAAVDLVSETSLKVTVPPGALTGNVTVELSTPNGPTVSNALPFEVLDPSSGALRLAAKLAPAGGPELEQVMALSPRGDLLLVAERTSPDNYGLLHVLDIDPRSATFNQFLDTGTAAPFDTSVADVAVVPDGKRAFVVLADRDTIPVIDVDRYSSTFGKRVDVIAMGSYVAPPTKFAVSPDGQVGLAMRSGLVNIVDLVEESPTRYQSVDSVSVVGSFEYAAFHPSGTVAYLAGDGTLPAVHVVDVNPSSVDFGNVITSMPFPSVEHPRSISFTPDGDRCLVLALVSPVPGDPYDRMLFTIDSSDPRAPVLWEDQVYGTGSLAIQEVIDVSPRGDRAIFHIEGAGFEHIDLTTEPYGTVETAFGSLNLTNWDIGYAPDASAFYGVSADNDSVYVFDFNEVQTMAIESGNLQTGVVDQALALPLRVKLTDASADPIEGIPVTFEVQTGGGFLTATNSETQTVSTDANGVADAFVQLGSTAGDSANSVEARAVGLIGSPVTFYANAVQDPLTQPLTYVSITPGDGTSNVDVLTAIQMTFSRAVDPESASNSTFYVRKSTDPATAVPAIIGFTDLNRKLSLSPIDQLEPNTTYIVEATAGLRDASGGALDLAVAKSFTTEPPPPLKLASIAAPSALVSATVVLAGTGFDPDLGGNTVTFGDKAAELSDGSTDFLQAVVPLDATSDSVRVTTTAGTSNALFFGVLAATTSSVDEVLDAINIDSPTRGIAINPAGTWAYAISMDPPVVIPIDIAAKTSYPGIPVGNSPTAIDIHPNGKYAYVANFGSNSVTIINIDAADTQHFNTPDTTVIVGANPIDLVASPLGDRVYVANIGSSDISVLDVEEGSSTFNFVIDSGTVKEGARAVAINPAGTLLYVGTDDGYVVLDTQQGLLVLSGTDKKQGTKQIVMSPAGTRLYVLTTEGDLFVYDIEPGSPTENQVTDSVSGRGGKSISMSPAGTMLYLALQNDQVLVFSVEEPGNMAVIEDAGAEGMSELTLVNELYLGSDIGPIAFDPTGSGLALVSCAGDELVLILNTSDVSVGALQCAVEVTPRTLNLKSRGRWVEGRIELAPSPPFNVRDIDIGSVLLNGLVQAEPDRFVIEDANQNGIDELVVQFDRMFVQSILPVGSSVEVMISGTAGTRTFAGLDTISTIRPNVKFPSGGEALDAGSNTNVTWTSPEGSNPDVVDVHWTPNDGVDWYPIAEGIPNSGSVKWSVPATPHDSCRVMITLYENGLDVGMGMSQGMFKIEAPADMALIGFNGSIKRGTPVVQWRTGIELSTTDGFHLLRAEKDAGEYERLTSELIPSKGQPGGADYVFTDDTARPNQDYFYKLQLVSGAGEIRELGPFEVTFRASFSLEQNFPNPFNTNTMIRFTIPREGHVDLAIYDAAGRLVKKLISSKKQADFYEVLWDGTNAGGERVATGVYFYHLRAGSFNKTRKMTLLR